MEAILAVMRLEELEELGLSLKLIGNAQVLELNQILLFNELVALLEATWQEADVLCSLLVEYLNDRPQHSFVELLDIARPILSVLP